MMSWRESRSDVGVRSWREGWGDVWVRSWRELELCRCDVMERGLEWYMG